MVNIIMFQYAVLYSLELDFSDLHLALLSLNYILTHYSVAWKLFGRTSIVSG
jgi:hypothetical protein